MPRNLNKIVHSWIRLGTLCPMGSWIQGTNRLRKIVRRHTSVGDSHDIFAHTVLDKKGFLNEVIVFYSVKDVTESSDTCCGLHAGSLTRDVQLRFFSQIIFPDAPESPYVAILIDYENSRRRKQMLITMMSTTPAIMRKVRVRKLFHILYWDAIGLQLKLI